jgi:hypothetical protein
VRTLRVSRRDRKTEHIYSGLLMFISLGKPATACIIRHCRVSLSHNAYFMSIASVLRCCDTLFVGSPFENKE